jgi:protein TonB
MDRHYMLPATFAAVAHAALLFGISKDPHAPELEFVRIISCPLFTLPPEPEPPVVENDDSGPENAKPTLDVPLIQQPEPPTLIAATEMVIPVPRLQPFTPGDVTKIALPAVAPGSGSGDSPWPRNVLPIDRLDNSPRTRFQAAPIYPFEAKQQGLHGDVIVEFLVDEHGEVREPRVVSSSHRMFEESALRAVAKWKFEPGRQNGRVVRFKMAVPIVFKLNND